LLSQGAKSNCCFSIHTPFTQTRVAQEKSLAHVSITGLADIDESFDGGGERSGPAVGLFVGRDVGPGVGLLVGRGIDETGAVGSVTGSGCLFGFCVD